ncbi:MAG: RagB/SusD family nutrient uptake outer membrane protein [Tannerella sp.]|jgi:tetratricopeptide (TPR) repeat protein|nr:RagB/SusD family nutrient uptake outer membrane protein [Tannerella sp.]
MTAFGLACLSSCSDFFDHPLTNAVSDDNISEVILNNPSSLESFLANGYRTLGGINLYGRHIQYATAVMSHEMDLDYIAEEARNQYSQNSLTSVNSIVLLQYSEYYKILTTLNTLDDLISHLDLSKFTDVQVRSITNLKGEMHFLRAYCHFELLCLFGEKGPHFGGDYPNNRDAQGITLAMQLTTAETAYASRSTVGECYQAILDDLEEAERHIGNNQIPANNVIRGGNDDTDYTSNIGWAQLPAVRALRGKVYLYMSDYEKARTEFEAILSDGRFKLDKPVNFTDYIQHADNNAESIFALQFYYYTGPADSYSGAPNHQVARIFGNVPGAWMNYFIDARNPLRFGDDPRLYEATLYDYTWDNSNWATWQRGSWTQLDVTAPGFRCFPRKMVDFYNSSNPGTGNTKNLERIRLGDVYLMYAEVQLKLGNTAVATEYVNKVRRRAWDEADYNALGTKGEDFATVTMELLQEERFKEFFFENHRWFDMCRWGIIAQELAKYPRTMAGDVHYDDNDYYLPIPERELRTNPNLSQSWGY